MLDGGKGAPNVLGHHAGGRGGSFSFGELPASVPCPSRHGLYQVMRNRVLADCLRIKTPAQWSDVALCIHPLNLAAQTLEETTSGAIDVFEAFARVAPSPAALRHWPADHVLAAIGSDGQLATWHDRMRDRYLLQQEKM